MSAVMSLEPIYGVIGALLVSYGAFSLRDRPLSKAWSQALFWAVLGVVMAAGSLLPSWLVGLLVVVLVALDGARLLGLGRYGDRSDDDRLRRASEIRGQVFIPVLVVPVATFVAALSARILGGNVGQSALLGLGYGAIISGVAAMIVARSGPRRLVQQGRRLSEIIGGVVLLPPLLASLGLLFKEAGVGDLVSGMLSSVVPHGSLFAGIAAYCTGMALFTVIMGNGFAAFAVITAGIGVPFVLRGSSVNPNLVTAMALTAGYCGTLLTPMAANFNIVPMALLEMKGRLGVIRFQAPFALALLLVHILLLWGLASWT